MIALLSLAKDGVVPRSRHAPRESLHCPPLPGLSVVRAPLLGWTLLLFQHLGECRDCVALHDGGCYDLLEPVVPPVGVASAW